jgi:hypothetical protein
VDAAVGLRSLDKDRDLVLDGIFHGWNVDEAGILRPDRGDLVT